MNQWFGNQWFGNQTSRTYLSVTHMSPNELDNNKFPASKLQLCRNLSWASVSRKLMPPSEFWHPLFEYSTRPKQCRPASASSSTRLVPASLFFFIPVPDWSNAGQSGIYTHAHDTHTHTLGYGQAAWTLTNTCSMEMGMHHGHGQAAWMPKCRNADEKFSLAFLVFH